MLYHSKKLYVTLCTIIFSLTLQAAEKPHLVGIAASPLTTPDNPTAILILAKKYSPDFIELKTACDIHHPPRPQPHIAAVLHAQQVTPSEHPQTVTCTTDRSRKSRSLVNSIGLASSDPNDVEKGIKEIIDLFKRHVISTKLIFSIHGSSLHGFVAMAQRAAEMRVPYVSVNFSCPNIKKESSPLYKDPEEVFSLVHHVRQALGSIPLLVKIGAFREDEEELMASVVKAIAAGRAYGIYGINSVPVYALDESGNSIFGAGREICGATGAQIKNAALDFVIRARALIAQNNYNLKLFACGGATTHDDFEVLFNAGADAVFAATTLITNRTFTFPRKFSAKL